MKKIINLLLILILIFNFQIIVKAKSFNMPIKEQNNQTPLLEEKIIPVYKDNKLIRLNIVITINEDCEEDELIISPSVFKQLNKYKNTLSNDSLKINLKIINNSSYNYNYINNSFILSTEKKDLNFQIYRTINEPITSLYNYKNIDKIKEEDLKDSSLDKILIEKGYRGIDELDKYYLDYYNRKYNLKEIALDDFTYSTIKDIFSGKKSNIKENNPNITTLSYNYFYNKLLSVTFPDQKITDYNSEDYSIGEYMRNNLGEEYIKNKFLLLRSKTYSEIENISLNLNKTYTTEAYILDNISTHLEFKLTKEELIAPFQEQKLIIPPFTSID